MTSNVRLSFPLTTSNSFQVPSPDFPYLQHLKFFIQASKSNFKKKSIQVQFSKSCNQVKFPAWC